MNDDKEWKDWRDHILRELEILHRDNRKILVEIATLKAQSAFWGAVSGIVFAGIVSFLLK